jgi:hypothetical protein
MKKQIIWLLFSVLITSVLISCTQKTIKTKEKDFTKRYYLEADTSKGSLNVDIEVEFPVAYRDKKVLDSIRSTIISNVFGDEYVSLPDDSIIPRFTKDTYADYIDNNRPLLSKLEKGSPYEFNNEHVVSGYSLLSDKNIYVYGIDRYVFMGGAHGLETRDFLNFDLSTGKLITEKDLFIDDYPVLLSDLIKKRIVEQSQEDNDREPILDLENTDYWTDSIKPNGNFYITDESINYVFNPYEIAPYALGQTEISLPFERLRDIMKPNGLIEYLIEKHAEQIKMSKP